MTEGKQTLDKKYRAPTLEALYGNEAVKKSIAAVVARQQDLPASILLSGPSGCGKTTVARIIAAMVGSGGRDLKEYNISDMRGIDTARNILDLIEVPPMWAEKRVIILNECHRGTTDFWNAMLEVLEEPPEGNHFILCTTEPKALKRTVHTRCTPYTLRLLNAVELTNLVLDVARQEEVEMSAATRLVSILVQHAEGSPRAALVLLDSIIDLPSFDEMEAVMDAYTVPEETMRDLCQALLKGQPWDAVGPLLKGIKEQPEDLRRGMLFYFESVVYRGGQNAARACDLLGYFERPTYDTGRPGLTMACYRAAGATAVVVQ